MTGYPEKQSSKPQTQLLTIRLPEELLDTIKVFCADNDLAIEKFAVEALSEKLNRWKE